MRNSIEQAAPTAFNPAIAEVEKPLALIIEPSEERRSFLQINLPENGISPIICTSFEEAKYITADMCPDIVIADASSVSNIRVFNEFDRPFIITDKADHTKEPQNGNPSRVVAILDCGADFYISSNSSPEAIAAHVRSSLRSREPKTNKDFIRVGDMIYDSRGGRFIGDGNEIKLTVQERKLANFLFLNRGKPLSKEAVLRNSLGEEYGDRDLTVLVHRLRAKLGQFGETNKLHTIQNYGYIAPSESATTEEYISQSEKIPYPEEAVEDSNDHKIKVLVVDKDYSALNYLRVGLRDDLFQVVTTTDAPTAAKILKKNKQDFVIVSEGLVIMPNSKGETLKWITMLKNEQQASAALDSGSFSTIEKFPNLESLSTFMLRHKWTEVTNTLSVIGMDGIEVNIKDREVIRNGEVLDLTRTEFQLLKLLAENAGSVLAGNEIIARIWGSDKIDDVYNLFVYIGRLRNKLKSKKIINNIKGLGYVFIPSNQQE